MKITSEGFDYHYFIRDSWNEWACFVVNDNKTLRPNERARLLGALTFPDMFEDGLNEYLLYKALRGSENDLARSKASELALRCGRFARMEGFLAGRERRADMKNVIQLVRPKQQPAFPVLNPAAVGGFGVFFGLQQAPVSPIFRPAAVPGVA